MTVRRGKFARLAAVWLGLVGLISVAPAVSRAETSGNDPDPGVVQSYTDRFAIVPYIGTPPEIDGTLAAAEWSEAWRAGSFLTMYYNKITPAATDLYMMYDDEHLYIGMQGRYADSAAPPPVERVDVLLKPRRDGAVYRLSTAIALGGRDVNADWGGSVSGLTPKQAKVTRHDDHWTLELAIALSDLGVSAVNPGDAWSFNVMRYFGVNSGPFASFVPIRHSYIADTGGARVSLVAHALNQNRMAPLYFSRLPAARPGREVIAAKPARAALRYTGFTAKELTIAGGIVSDAADVEMVWLSPDGLETVLAASRIVRAGDEATIAFEHPRPLAEGLYRLKLFLRQGEGADHYLELAFDRTALIDAGERVTAWTRPSGPKREVPYRPPSETVQRLLELIPENTGFIFTGLPEDPTLRPYQLYDWSPDNPWQMTAKTTGTVYPNEQYPENRVLRVVNPLGKTVEYPYYEGPDGKRYFFTAHLWYFQKDYVLRETSRLASIDPLGAARLLNRWAEVYEGYLPTNDYYWTNYLLETGPPYHYWGGVWYRWYTGDMANLKHLLDAFAIVSRTNAFELLSEELGYDVQARIVEKMFKPSFDYVRSFPVLNHNMEYNTWRGLIAMSKATGDPSYIHHAVELMENYAQNHYLFDGFWKEVTLSYHNQSTNGLITAMNEAMGWSDPDGYVSPRTGRTFERLDLSQTFPAINAARSMGHLVSYPNGSYVAMQDTWANQRSSSPMTARGSFLLPASGIVRLAPGGASSAVKQTQVYLMFTPKYGHNHLDPLNITLFAENQELLPDIGYTHTFFRRWTTSTLGHNTVVVNGQDMNAGGEGQHGGRIEALITTDPVVKIAKASHPAAYPVTDEYSREVWLVRFGGDSRDSYVVDLFRVAGGERHEYTLGGEANRDAAFETPIATEFYNDYLLPPGTPVRMPTSESDTGSAGGHYYGYLYVQDVQRAEVPDGQVELTLTTEANGAPSARLRITTLVEPGDNELFLGRAPSLRATRLGGTSRDINTEAVKYTMPKMVLRRSGTDLRSTFATVMEPYLPASGPKITAIERLTLDGAPAGSVALKVTYGEYVDYILSASDPREAIRVEGITLQGRGGFVRTQNGEVVEMVLAGGTLLQKGDQVVTGSGPETGRIIDVMRRADGDPVDALVTDAVLSGDYAGRYVIVTHPDGTTHGYLIKGVQRDGPRTLIVLDGTEAGWDFLPDGRARMAFYPFKEWQGEHVFRIDNIEVVRLAP